MIHQKISKFPIILFVPYTLDLDVPTINPSPVDPATPIPSTPTPPDPAPSIPLSPDPIIQPTVLRLWGLTIDILKIKIYILDRFSERVTWLGLITSITSFGIMISPNEAAAIANTGIFIVGAILAGTRG